MLDQGEVRRVTISVGDLARARHLYSDMLGMRVVGEWHLEAEAMARDPRLRWIGPALGINLDEPIAIEGLDLEQPGTRVGAVRLVRVSDGSGPRVNEHARAYDYGYVKNLDFFTDDVRAEHARFAAAGFTFLAPPVEYPVPWGKGAVATEAHMPTEDGVKISLAKMAGVPRVAMGRSSRETPFTEVAAATQIVRDFSRSEAFYCDVLDLVPAAPTVIEGELIEALHLPRGTRLRMSFLSGANAAGGRVGIVSYEGPGVTDARDLRDRIRAPHRGVLGLTFEVADVERVVHRSLALGATLRCAPSEQSLSGPSTFGAVVVSPDGTPLHFETMTAAGPGNSPEVAHPPAFARACAVSDLNPGDLREHRPKDGSPRIALANVSGEVFAFEDRCPHLGAPLSQGELRGRTLVCPWHGWMIDVPTGQVHGGRGASVRPCAVRVRDGDVLVASSGKVRE